MKSKPIIALGVCGSIAAYKAADLTSKLSQRDITVQVIMTKSACELIQPQTFFTLSQRPVITSLWNSSHWQPEHIALAEQTRLLIIAPATANIIGKIAHGIADDALSTYALSHTGEIVIVPAMNPRMWNNPIVQENCQILRNRGIIILEPDIGHVACGESGQGRFPDVNLIADFIQSKLMLLSLINSAISPKKILITAGPTQESLDPVRFLTNHSSGKMGFALANAACVAGCQTTLIAGPTQLTTPLLCRRINVTTAEEMKDTVIQEFAQADILIMCAAVADYRPEKIANQKIKKSESLSIVLERTSDILFTIKDLKTKKQRVIGFAAETQNLAEYAQQKLLAKNLDMIIANDISRQDIGFGTNENEVSIFSPENPPEILAKANKQQLSVQLIYKILSELY